LAAAAVYKPQDGERIYAVGDCHGRADLFEHLMRQLRQDSAARSPMATKIIVLGDVIDRGAQSAELVQRMMRYNRASDRFLVLLGNHEQMMLAALGGDLGALAAWMKIGGDQTLRSWGVPCEALGADGRTLLTVARAQVPAEVLHWMESLPLWHLSGSILFVHAGIKPGLPLAHQEPHDLLWIRNKFLTSDKRHPQLVVHGHSICEQGPDIRPNRIGIDTGAVTTGRLTAVGFEGDARWFLHT